MTDHGTVKQLVFLELAILDQTNRDRRMSQPIPESLTIAVDRRQQRVVQEWWAGLTTEQQAEFLEVATLAPEQIATPLETSDEEAREESTNEWYEYLVNQDVRFYYDRSDPQGNYRIVHPILTPISQAADIEIVSHLLTVPPRDGSSNE